MTEYYYERGRETVYESKSMFEKLDVSELT